MNDHDGKGVQNQTNPIEKPQIEPTQKPYLVRMYSEHFFTQPLLDRS